jgi:peptide/nickel transport system substrate-binding protein
MRNLRWQLLIAVGGLILILSYLLSQAPPQVSISTPAPVSGGIYREALIGTISRLNPILDFNNQVDHDINELLYRGLITFDSRGIPLPDLAESWAVSADATLYTFTLRKDILWHDGEPVRSSDVLYTFSKYQDADYPGPADYQSFWEEIKIVELDERTIQFQLPEPFAPFIDFLSVGLLPEHLLRGVSAGELIDHPFNTEPIGTGPFKFNRFMLNEEKIEGVELQAFDQFYQGRPYLDEFIFHFFPDEATAFQAYLNGEVIGISHVSGAMLDQALEIPTLNLHSARLPKIYVIFLNLNHPQKEFFSEKLFRRALLQSINRQWIIDTVLDGQAIIAPGPIFPSTWAYLDKLVPWAFDILEANSLLQDLGWELPEGASPNTPEYQRKKEDINLTFSLVHASNELHTSLAEAVAASWAQIGVQVELVSVEPEEILSTYLEPRDFEAVLTVIDLSSFSDPDPYPFWHDSQVETGQNYAGFTDRNISIWLEKARTTSDLATRADLYKSFQFRFNDQLPALILFSPIYNYAIDTDILGVSVGPMYDPSDRFQNVLDWFIQVQTATEPTVPASSTP